MIRNNIKLKVGISLGFALILTIFVQIYSERSIRKLADAKDWVTHTYNVISTTKDILSDLAITQGQTRGYAITSNKSFIKTHSEFNKTILENVALLKKITSDNKGQQKQIAELEPLINSKIDFQAKVLSFTDRGLKQEAMGLISKGQGEVLMVGIEKIIREMERKENILLKIRQEESDSIVKQVNQISLIGGLLGIIIVILSAFLIFQDINKRVELELQLKENESRLIQILEALPIGIYVVNSKGTGLIANKKAKEIMGSGLDPNIGKSESAPIYPAHRAGSGEEYPRTEMPVFKALEGVSSSLSDIEIKKPEGNIFLEVKGAPVYDIEGKVSYGLAAFQDITQRKIADEELRKAKEIAESSAVTKERFLANMSHEIRTPLNAIIGFTNLIDRNQLNEENKEFIEAIKSSGYNLLTIINDILDFSKIEAGMMAVETTTFNISSLLNSLDVMLGQKAREKKIELTITKENDLPENVLGDPTRLTQILINLIGNAIKFTEIGQVEVFVKVKKIEGTKVFVEFKVKDSGIGIADEKIAEIFERFNQASTETTRKYGGTGLGLSIAKSLVDIQGGELSVKSEIGKGSLFTFYIPYEITSVHEPAIIKNTMNFVRQVKLGKLSVLLAEDNILNQKLAVKVLSGFGFETDVAVNGKKAIEMLEHKDYDVILMDMQMPEMDGYEATRIIRKELKHTIPIIAMTAHALPGEREKCISHGMNDYVSKPFNPEELYNKIALLTHSTLKYIDSDVELKATNFGYLKDLADGNDEFIVDMLDLFLKHVPVDLETLSKAIEAKNFKEIRRIAHKLKSTINIMGMIKVEPLLTSIEENSLAERNYEEIVKQFESIGNYCNKAYSEIKFEKLNFMK